MKRKTPASSDIKRQIKREIDAMHKATAEFVGVCIGISKTHPKGLKRIKQSVDRIVNNMSRLDKMYGKLVK